MAGKVIGMVASGDLKSLIPELPEFSLPSIDDILEQIPDPEDVANSIKESVEGIVESVQEQVEQVIEETVGIARETIEAIQKSAEEIIEAGENLIEAGEQAAADLAENVEEFGRDVDKFFENLEKSLSEEEEDQEQSEIEREAIENAKVPGLPEIPEPRTLEDVETDERLSYRSVARGLLNVYASQLREGISGTGQYDASVEFLINTFPLDQLEKTEAYLSVIPDDYNEFTVPYNLRGHVKEAINIIKTGTTNDSME